MNIGDVADKVGLPAKTIRYYEDIGLVKPLRDNNGYRAFQANDLHKLTFLARARKLGLPSKIAALFWHYMRIKPAPVPM